MFFCVRCTVATAASSFCKLWSKIMEKTWFHKSLESVFYSFNNFNEWIKWKHVKHIAIKKIRATWIEKRNKPTRKMKWKNITTDNLSSFCCCALLVHLVLFYKWNKKKEEKITSNIPNPRAKWKRKKPLPLSKMNDVVLTTDDSAFLLPFVHFYFRQASHESCWVFSSKLRSFLHFLKNSICKKNKTGRSDNRQNTQIASARERRA